MTRLKILVSFVWQTAVDSAFVLVFPSRVPMEIMASLIMQTHCRLFLVDLPFGRESQEALLFDWVNPSC